LYFNSFIDKALTKIELGFETDVKFFHMFSKVKGKAISLQAWTGPESSRKLRLPDFKPIGT